MTAMRAQNAVKPNHASIHLLQQGLTPWRIYGDVEDCVVWRLLWHRV